jgi:hypothetical protein
MNCKKVHKLLPLYIGEDLDTQELSEVKAHISECLSCYREYQSHLKALRSLRDLKNKPDLSEVLKGFTGEVMQRIVRDSGGPAAPLPRVSYAFVPRSLAAAALLLAVLTVTFFMTGRDEYPGPMESGAAEADGIHGGPVPASTAPASTEFIRTYPLAHEDTEGKEDLFKKLDPDEKLELVPLDRHPHRFPEVIPVNNPHDL